MGKALGKIGGIDVLQVQRTMLIESAQMIDLAPAQRTLAVKVHT